MKIDTTVKSASLTVYCKYLAKLKTADISCTNLILLYMMTYFYISATSLVGKIVGWAVGHGTGCELGRELGKQVGSE